MNIYPVGTSKKRQRQFMNFPKTLYADAPNWVPWFDTDMHALLTKKHPFFGHAEGDFFLLEEAGEVIGRFCVVKNQRYNEAHGTDFAHFSFYDSIDSQPAADAIFAHVKQWTREHDLGAVCGPLLSGGVAGSGIMVNGFDKRPSMTMMPFNYPYYQRLFENAGLVKYVDLYNLELPPGTDAISPRISAIAEKILQRGRFKVLQFRNKKGIRRRSEEIKQLYNGTLTHHLEDYPLTEAELNQVRDDLLTIADPNLVKILTYDDKIIGYVFAFTDLSEVLRKNRGKLGPVQLLRLLRNMKNSDRVLFNGMGILPEYQRLGGNALLYAELAKTVKDYGFRFTELVHISEETVLMLSDAASLGAEKTKTFRMYQSSAD